MQRVKALSLVFAIFWLIYLLAMTFYAGQADESRGIEANYAFGLAWALNAVLFHVALNALNVWWLIPNWLLAGKYGRYVLILVSSVMVAALLRGFVELAIHLYFGKGMVLAPSHFVGIVLGLLLWLAVFTMLKFSADWLANEEKQRILEKQKLVAELNFLKTQINPHFFFNTLNNLYALAYKNAPETPQVILKLSELMRYMLYESKEQQVPLDKEIEFLRNYIDLQMLRITDRSVLSFNIDGDTSRRMIEPLLFVPFIENAFKYLRKNEAGHYVRMHLQVQPNSLLFVCDNTHGGSNMPKKPNLGGIGLENVRRRLQLLYPGRHLLAIDNTATHYHISITLYDPR